MDRDDILWGLFAAATVLCAGETAFRLKDRNASRARFLRERWTLEKDWERFDAKSGWELISGYASDDLRINRQGFRGPELAAEKTRRVLCLGDSVTFGPPGEKIPYPYVAREVLSGMESEPPVEVINAGVGGHSSANMRFRISRLMRLKPEVVVVFAGWNDMFSDDIAAYADQRGPVASFWHMAGQRNINCHLAEAFCRVMGRAGDGPVPVSYAPAEFVPFNFDYNLRAIIGTITGRGARAALVTLPRLIPDDASKLTPAMIRKVMLPQYIGVGNYDDFNTVYRAYDTVIRKVAEDTETPLIDAAAMFDEQKRPRSMFFDDTCHLSPQGHALMGKFIAGELVTKGLIA